MYPDQAECRTYYLSNRHTSQGSHDRVGHVKRTADVCALPFKLWAVHVILASPIVYSLLPGPHRVLKKRKSKG